MWQKILDVRTSDEVATGTIEGCPVVRHPEVSGDHSLPEGGVVQSLDGDFETFNRIELLSDVFCFGGNTWNVNGHNFKHD